MPQPGYMERQPHINSQMRGILVDWLVDVHKKYKLKTETLFLAVNIIDRYLEQRQIARRHLQLIGITAMLVAAKFEEIYPPQIKEFVYITDHAYTYDEMVNMEISILRTLDFNFTNPTAAQFFERYHNVNRCGEAHRYLAQYILELTLGDHGMIRYAPSHLAAAAVLLSNKLQRREPQWSPACQRQTRLTAHMLRACMRDMCGLLEGADRSSLQAVRKKFSQQKYHCVAKLNVHDWAPPASARGATPREPGLAGDASTTQATTPRL